MKETVKISYRLIWGALYRVILVPPGMSDAVAKAAVVNFNPLGDRIEREARSWAA